MGNLNSSGSTGCFIEVYAGIDLHSSNNSGFAPEPALWQTHLNPDGETAPRRRISLSNGLELVLKHP